MRPLRCKGAALRAPGVARREGRAGRQTRPARIIFPLLLGATLPLAGGIGCENADPDLFRPVTGTGATGPVSLAAEIQPTFTASCAISGCHAGAAPAAGLTLEAGRLYDAQLGAVGVPSVEAALLRIEPGRSDRSYLVDKLRGTQAAAGGGGATMPLGFPALDSAFIDRLAAWIDDGAQDN